MKMRLSHRDRAVCTAAHGDAKGGWSDPRGDGYLLLPDSRVSAYQQSFQTAADLSWPCSGNVTCIDGDDADGILRNLACFAVAMVFLRLRFEDSRNPHRDLIRRDQRRDSRTVRVRVDRIKYTIRVIRITSNIAASHYGV